jgi:pimeloyl-ACP methyl ester carboxylesterase
LITESVARPSEAMQACLAEEAPSGEALSGLWSLYAPVRAWLSERPSGSPEIALASVFTTQNPVREMFTLYEAIQALPEPTPREVVSVGVQRARTNYELFRGRYSAPRFQEGEIPYKNQGGAIRFDEAGAPIVQGEENLRFSLSVPADDELPMPEGGWPVVLYAHGTGGNYESYYRGDVALTLARQGLAVLSIDQIHHGERDGGQCDGPVNYAQCVSLLFFNFLIPEAGRDNVRQSALDFVSLTRLVPHIDLPAELSDEGRAVKLNPNKVMFMGHSQGGLNGPLFMAIEPKVLGGVLSGAGSNIAISLEQKTKPFNLNAIVRAALGLPAGEPLDRWHPSLSLLQTFLEPGDSANFGRFWFAEPAEGHVAKSVFMTVGLQDEFTPPDTTFALATSGRVPLIEPIFQPIEALDFLGVESTGLPPFSANVADGSATAGLAQFETQGHYVVFESASAKERYGKFLSDLANRSIPKIY